MKEAQPFTLEQLARDFLDTNENSAEWRSPGGARRLLVSLLARVDENADKRGRAIAEIIASRDAEARAYRRAMGINHAEDDAAAMPAPGPNETCLRCDAPAVVDRRCQYHLDRKHLDNPDGTYPRPGALTVREACRLARPLDGADAKALEHALTITERERDALAAKLKAVPDKGEESGG